MYGSNAKKQREIHEGMNDPKNRKDSKHSKICSNDPGTNEVEIKSESDKMELYPDHEIRVVIEPEVLQAIPGCHNEPSEAVEYGGEGDILDCTVELVLAPDIFQSLLGGFVPNLVEPIEEENVDNDHVEYKTEELWRCQCKLCCVSETDMAQQMRDHGDHAPVTGPDNLPQHIDKTDTEQKQTYSQKSTNGNTANDDQETNGQIATVSQTNIAGHEPAQTISSANKVAIDPLMRVAKSNESILSGPRSKVEKPTNAQTPVVAKKRKINMTVNKAEPTRGKNDRNTATPSTEQTQHMDASKVNNPNVNETNKYKSSKKYILCEVCGKIQRKTNMSSHRLIHAGLVQNLAEPKEEENVDTDHVECKTEELWRCQCKLCCVSETDMAQHMREHGNLAPVTVPDNWPQNIDKTGTEQKHTDSQKSTNENTANDGQETNGQMATVSQTNIAGQEPAQTISSANKVAIDPLMRVAKSNESILSGPRSKVEKPTNAQTPVVAKKRKINMTVDKAETTRGKNDRNIATPSTEQTQHMYAYKVNNPNVNETNKYKSSKKYILCEVCGKIQRKTNISSHRLIHAGSETDMAQHMREHGDRTPVTGPDNLPRHIDKTDSKQKHTDSQKVTNKNTANDGEEPTQKRSSSNKVAINQLLRLAELSKPRSKVEIPTNAQMYAVAKKRKINMTVDKAEKTRRKNDRNTATPSTTQTKYMDASKVGNPNVNETNKCNSSKKHTVDKAEKTRRKNDRNTATPSTTQTKYMDAYKVNNPNVNETNKYKKYIVCEVCGKIQRKTTMSSHKLILTGTKFTCDSCKQTLSRKSYVYEHIILTLHTKTQ